MRLEVACVLRGSVQLRLVNTHSIHIYILPYIHCICSSLPVSPCRISVSIYVSNYYNFGFGRKDCFWVTWFMWVTWVRRVNFGFGSQGHMGHIHKGD